MIDVKAIIDRLKSAFSVQTDIELAQLLEVSNKTVSSWRTRNSVPVEVVLQTSWATNQTVDYLLFGTKSETAAQVSTEAHFSEADIKDFKILGRSVLVSILGEFSPEQLAFMEDAEITARGEAIGNDLAERLAFIRRERIRFEGHGNFNEKLFAEYAAKVHHFELPYFATGVRARSKIKGSD